MTPSTITLTIFAIALALFVADFLPMGLLVFSVPMALYFAGIIEAKEIFAPLIGQSIVLVASSVAVCTPLAIPANSMILEPGNLRFKDFFRPGIALSAAAFALSMALLPILYPFFP